jgi:hypothetical protein
MCFLNLLASLLVSKVNKYEEALKIVSVNDPSEHKSWNF